MIVLCFDGSPDSEAAAVQTAVLFPGAEVTVLTVWTRYLDMLTSSGYAMVYAATSDRDDVDDELRGEAERTAAAGVETLRGAGLSAVAQVEPRQRGVADTILRVADELGADAIVTGTRGRGGVTSALLGSVSHEIVQHATRPVTVVPSAAVMEARARERANQDP